MGQQFYGLDISIRRSLPFQSWHSKPLHIELQRDEQQNPKEKWQIYYPKQCLLHQQKRQSQL